MAVTAFDCVRRSTWKKLCKPRITLGPRDESLVPQLWRKRFEF
jgi:hypothetical protein